jgi:hypothetical protein
MFTSSQVPIMIFCCPIIGLHRAILHLYSLDISYNLHDLKLTTNALIMSTSLWNLKPSLGTSCRLD